MGFVMVVHPAEDSDRWRGLAAAEGMRYRIDTRVPRGGGWVLNPALTYNAATNLESYRPRVPGGPLIQ